MTLYKKIIAVSLLLVAGQHHVVMALEPAQIKLPEPIVEQESLQDPDYPRYSTDKNMYEISVVEQPAEPGLVIEPVVISDKKVGNYFNNGVTRTLITQETHDGKLITTTERWITRNPSYLTATNGALALAVIGGAVGLTYYLMQRHYQQEEIAKIESPLYAYEEKIYTRYFGALYVDGYKKWLQDHKMKHSHELLLEYSDRMSAFHEAGHALEEYLTNPANWMYKATIEPEIIKGSVSAGGYVKSISLKPHRFFPVYLKNQIKIDFAGGAAMMQQLEKKLPFDDFLATQSFGMGDRSTKYCDVYNAYEQAESYLKRVHGDAGGSWIPKDYTQEERDIATYSFLKECYDEVCNDLASHQKELCALADALHDKKNIYANDIYTHASGKQNYVFGLMSSGKQWKQYISDVVSHELNVLADFYEHSPYEMHVLNS